MKKWPLIFLPLALGCGPSNEEIQRHHNQIMVAQHRIISAFDQLDSSLLDSSGYRLLYWEYDSVTFFIQQMNNVLDTITVPVNDPTLVEAARKFTLSVTELHAQHYPPFLDAFRKYHSLGASLDSIAMINHWENITNRKIKITDHLKSAQDQFVSEYNLTIF